jgi:accessory gene regulator B
VIIIERLAHRIADKISLQLELDKDQNAVIAYGLIGILQVITLFIVISIFGHIFDFLYEALIVFFSVGFIRKSTGGAHASTMNACNIISIMSISLLGASARYLFNYHLNFYANLTITIFVYAMSFMVFYFRVPVDNPNKPIVKLEKIKRLRRESFFKLTLFFLLTIASIKLASYYEGFYSIGVSIILAIIWQVFTLTKTGTLLLDKLDTKVNLILGKR